jgi:site-specific DNA-methyltransferase (adenine-specific)
MKYQIIYADPPWQYNDKKGNDPAMGGITYQTMPTKDIFALPISELADTNCALFMWVTMPMLPDGLEVLKAWEFDYVTCAFTWVKQNKSGMGIYSGLGHWTNGNAELCLLGRKGKLNRLDKSVKQIMLAPLQEHSRKPTETRERIIRLLGDLPRVELFARRKVEGWDCWGNEVESDIELVPAKEEEKEC